MGSVGRVGTMVCNGRKDTSFSMTDTKDRVDMDKNVRI